MINMNQAGFSREVDNFDSQMQANHIDYEDTFFHSCSGEAIAELNACISCFDTLISNVNSMYSATSGYLHKANYNINLCEETNSVTSTTSEE